MLWLFVTNMYLNSILNWTYTLKSKFNPFSVFLSDKYHHRCSSFPKTSYRHTTNCLWWNDWKVLFLYKWRIKLCNKCIKILIISTTHIDALLVLKSEVNQLLASYIIMQTLALTGYLTMHMVYMYSLFKILP